VRGVERGVDLTAAGGGGGVESLWCRRRGIA